MLLQSGHALPPPGVIKPDFESQRAREKRGILGDNSWLEVPLTTIDVGMDDPEEPENNIPRYFGWDNEKPIRRGIKVSPFRVRSYPITNKEYAKYLHANSTARAPASWELPTSQVSNGNSGNTQSANGGDGCQMQSPRLKDSYSVKTVFGPIPLSLALDWPVMASYDELSGCVEWMGGRIPSVNELKAVYQHIDKMAAIEGGLARRNDAVNGFVYQSYLEYFS
jgi:formylglycine-generating enzyme required for sulfatase activity